MASKDMRIGALLRGLVALVALAACAGSGETIDARGKPSEEVALIKGTVGPTEHTLLVMDVDGQRFDPAKREVRLAPGRHKVTFIYWDMVYCIPLIECFSPTSYAYVLTADVEVGKGRVYQTTGEGTYAEPQPIRLRIVDELTEEVIWTGETRSEVPNLIMN